VGASGSSSGDCFGYDLLPLFLQKRGAGLACLPVSPATTPSFHHFRKKGIVLKIYKRYKKQTENPRSI
jgi:hypothetical protein